MFQKFTEKAVNAVQKAKETAKKHSHPTVYPEHLLYALADMQSELGAKLLKVQKITPEKIEHALCNLFSGFEKAKEPVFGRNIKKVLNKALEIAQNYGKGIVGTEHLFYAVFLEPSDVNESFYKSLGIDIEKVRAVMGKIFENDGKAGSLHPESDDIICKKEDAYAGISNIANEPGVEKIFSGAVAKLTTSQYEILGSEQIMQSILEDNGNDTVSVLKECGITSESFSAALEKITSRYDEYEDKQIIFTPNALRALILASENAKEQGSTSIKPEHIVLGILQSKKGIAFNILKQLSKDADELEKNVLKALSKQMSETGLILKFAKQEAVRCERSTVGTEAVLAGIMLESTGIGFEVLKDLGITLKDIRVKTKEFLGEGQDYDEKEITFTARAKVVLEKAWQLAKKCDKTKIYSEHLLEAICDTPECVAAKVLTTLGADSLEIKEGIRKKLSRFGC